MPLQIRHILLRTLFFVAGAVLLQGCAQQEVQQYRESAHLRILHWNDFHAHNVPFEATTTDSTTGKKLAYKVGGAGNFLGYLKQFGKGRNDVAVLNAGDNFQGTPISSLTYGRSQIELMNITNPDAMALGNHEFDYGLQHLRDDMSIANFPILAANLYDSTTGKTFAAATLVKQFDKVRVGFIGLLPPDLPILTMKQNLTRTGMLDIDSVVSTQIKNLRRDDKVDLIVIISHMGVEQDTMLASRHNDIDVIVGGHTHMALFKPIKKNRTVVVQAGSWGRYVGKLDLIVDLEGDSVLNYAGELIETKLGMYGIDSVAEAKALALEGVVAKELNEVIGTLAVEWKRSFTKESNIGNWEADVMREFGHPDIALVNSGSLRKNMSPGPITKRDMWEMNPFSNTFVKFSITGRSLMQMLEWQAAKKGELMQISGLRYAYDSDKPAGNKVLEATVGGKPIEPDRSYSIVTNNYVTGHLPELLGLDDPSIVLTDLSVVDRDVMIDFIRRQRIISSKIEGRIVDRVQSSTGGDSDE